MNKIEAIKTIIDELSKSERESLMEILNGATVKSREKCPECGADSYKYNPIGIKGPMLKCYSCHRVF